MEPATLKLILRARVQVPEVCCALRSGVASELAWALNVLMLTSFEAGKQPARPVGSGREAAQARSQLHLEPQELASILQVPSSELLSRSSCCVASRHEAQAAECSSGYSLLQTA